MRLGFFGGSFDPPHRGHLAVALAAADAFGLDEVLLVPTALQPLKAAPPAASYADRLAMVRLLCDADPRLQASELEAPSGSDSQLPSYTVDSLARLRDQRPEASLSVIVGADAFRELARWRQPDRLLSLADWIVVSRPGVPLADPVGITLSPQQRLRVHRLHSVVEPVSATAIRAALATAASCEDLLPAAVAAYIRQHQLYR